MQRRYRPVIGCLLAVALAVGPGLFSRRAEAQQVAPDEAATMVLNSARRAYNEGNYPFASDRFREFLRQYGGHREAMAARYGLALTLLQTAEKDYKTIVENLLPVAGREDFAERPFALYYLASAQKALGLAALTEAEAKPQESAALRTQANQRFEEAARSFAQSAGAFAARVRKVTPPTTAPASLAPQASPDLEWAGRARADHCEMLLRVGRYKEAGQAAQAFLADPVQAASRYRELALYHLGYASFMQKDCLAAGKALSRLAPFQQEFGVHARYLLARTHHLAAERSEAAAQYKAVLTGYKDQKDSAKQALGNPAALKPDQKAFLESLVNQPAPDYVVRAWFYLGLLMAEEGRFADALDRFTTLLQQHPKSSLATEAQLRQGYCQLQLRNFPEAARLLQPLTEHPRLADQALWWLGRTQVAGADPANAQAYGQALTAAVATLRRAADKAGQLAASDPPAKIRRGDILLELADTLQLARQFKEAAATYQQVLTENNNPDRAEEALQRQVTAVHLAGQYKESDELAQRFEKTYPKSTLLAAVLFRVAENSYLSATAAANDPNLPNRDQRLAAMFTEATTRYERLLKQFPDFQHVNLARQGLGTSQYRLGRHKEAVEALLAIPDADRTGELVTVNYLLADSILRTLPPEGDDALQAARLLEQLEKAAKLLESFLGAAGKHAQAADAMLKLGQSYQRIGALLADPAERTRRLTQARETYDRCLQQFGRDVPQATTVMERGRCLALLGNVNGAIGELMLFNTEPFRSSPAAPLAMVRLGPLLRSANRAAEAAAVLGKFRADFEAALAKDPARSDWVGLLQYEHALSLKESGKLAEAKAAFESLAKLADSGSGPPPHAGINAIWRLAQCRREELSGQLAAVRAAAARPAAKPEELTAANQAIDGCLGELRQSAAALQARAEQLARKSSDSEPYQQMLYELAWCHRVLAEAEIHSARQKLQQESADRARARLAGDPLPGQSPNPIRPREIPLSAIRLQPAEKIAREWYRKMLAASPDSALSAQGRLELAELLAQRDEFDAAMSLLAEALEHSPPADLAERIRLRLADCCLSSKDPQRLVTALGQVQPLLKSQSPPVAAEARYLAGEVRIRQQEWPKAIELLVPFRDQDPFRNIAQLADRALLRLGYAYGQTGQWDASRQANEILVQRFGQGRWVELAYYGIGWAWQNQKQFDNAVNAYTEVTRRTVAEVAPRAQLAIGLCRIEQKRWAEAAQGLLVVVFTYDCPALNGQALFEAGRAYMELKQQTEAAKLWQRVVRDEPDSRWGQAARQKLAELKPGS